MHLAIEENRLAMEIARRRRTGRARRSCCRCAPFRRIVKDYFLVCESYYEAIRAAISAQVEAIDVGRRALHDEGSALLIERLAGKVAIDHDTARRLFTLICVLHLQAPPRTGSARIAGRDRLLVLASASPRRLDLLRQIGIVPDGSIPPISTRRRARDELPPAHVVRLAEAKARAVQPRHPGAFILAADTVVACGRRILPKAGGRGDRARLPGAAVGPAAPGLWRGRGDRARRRDRRRAGSSARSRSSG